jgi:hypothetical protein
MFSRHLVETTQLDGRTLRLDLRLNWYRALPLSCVEQLAVTLDGAALDLSEATLAVAGRTHRAAELAERDDAWWHVADSGRLEVALDEPPDDGPHQVAVVIGTRIPYLVDPAGNAVVIVDRAGATVSP